MNKKYFKLIYITLLLAIILIACVSCAKDEDKEVEFFDNIEYTINYMDDIDSCRMILDGAENCKIYRSSKYTYGFELTQTYEEKKVAHRTAAGTRYYQNLYYTFDENNYVMNPAKQVDADSYQENMYYDMIDSNNFSFTVFTNTSAGADKQYSIKFDFDDGYLTKFKDTYFFTYNDGTLQSSSAVYTSAVKILDESNYSNWYNLLKDKYFKLDWQETIEGVTAYYTIYVQFTNESPQYCHIGYTRTIVEYEQAVGSYSIENGRYVNLEFNYEQDIPTKGLETYQNFDSCTPADETVCENLDNNGYLDIKYVSKVMVNDLTHVKTVYYNHKYVQLYENGTFTFGKTQTGSVEGQKVCYDTSSGKEKSYYGKTFTQELIVYNDNERYVYNYEISFNDSGYVTFTKKACKMTKMYYIVSENELTAMYFDIDQYLPLVGSHPTYGTDNNLSFANDIKVYVDYNQVHYVFDSYSEIAIRDYGTYYHIGLQHKDEETGGSYQIFVYYYPETGEYKWGADNFYFSEYKYV
jgi:hypothetical protein